MKSYLLCFYIGVLTMGLNAQAGWQTLGPNDFNQPSYNTVTTGASTGYVCSAIDGSGNLYVVYENDWNTNTGISLRATVMEYNGSSWASVGPDTGFSAGTATNISIAINPTNGHPYVVYADDANSAYATVMAYNGSNWVIVGTPGFSAGPINSTSSSIAFNSAGTPYVAFTNGFDGIKAEVWKYSGTSWSLVGGAAASTGQSRYNSLAINPQNNQPYLLYADNGTSPAFKAKVITYNGSSWAVVGTAGFSTSALGSTTTSLAFASNGTPYAAFLDGTINVPIEVWTYNGSSWSKVGGAAVAASAPNLNYISLAVNSSGTPYVVYNLGSPIKKAVVKMYNGSSWVNLGSATGISNTTTTYNSIAINSSGTPYVFYADNSSGGEVTALQYNGSAWQTVGPGYGITGNAATYPAIALDGSGTPYIAFYDVVLGSTVMKWNGITWANVGLPGFTGGSASYFSIAINPINGLPYLVYSE